MGQREEAEQSLRTAIQLDRNRPGPHAARGFLRVLGGRPEEGVAHLDEAVRLWPLDPELWLFRLGQAAAELLGGRPDAAIERAEESLEIRPLWHARVVLACAHALAGDVAAARAQRDAIRAERPEFGVAMVQGLLGSASPDVRARFVELLELADFPS